MTNPILSPFDLSQIYSSTNEFYSVKAYIKSYDTVDVLLHLNNHYYNHPQFDILSYEFNCYYMCVFKHFIGK